MWAALRGCPPKRSIVRLIGAVQVFAGAEPQGDDMTCVVLRIEESSSSQ